MADQTPTPAPAPVPTGHEMTLTERVRLWGGIAVVALLILFFAQNLDDADIQFLWFTWNVPLFFALLLSAIFGAVATLGIATIRSRAARQAAAQQSRQSQG